MWRERVPTSRTQRASGGTHLDERLFTRLHQEFRGPLLRSVRQLTGDDPQWAEDVVQETVLRAWRNAPWLSCDRGSLWAWLLTVARRIVIDDRRHRRIRPREVEPEWGADPPVPDEAEPALVGLVVSEALLGLSEHHREVLAHVYLCDRTVNETANALGIPPGTVKSRLHYARHALRERLRGTEP